MIYDLVVIGNGIAAQTFLFELFLKLDVKQSQNYSVAQVYSEDIAPACSMRSMATVSLSGIEENISDLGNELRDSYFLFKEFQNSHRPYGVEEIKQIVSFTSEKEKAKMIRRYKTLKKISHSNLKEEIIGTELSAFLIGPELLSEWFNEQLSHRGITLMKNFLINIVQNKDGNSECHMLNKEIITAKKIVFCTGAYAKLFSQFYQQTEYLNNTSTVAGSYLERSLDLNRTSFALTIDSYKLIYRSQEKKIVIGSSSKDNGVVIAEHQTLNEMLEIFNQKFTFSLGQLSDYSVVTGLRHKGMKRRPIACSLNSQKNIFLISGFYKNGYSFSHLGAKKVLSELFSD